MNTYVSFDFDTALGMLSLACIEVVEPHNGRMLYKVKLLLGETDLTERYFGSWNCINCNLERYNPVSFDKQWIYIPQEGSHFVIDSRTLAKVDLPYLIFSATTFMSNHFISDFLLIVSSREIIVKNLKTGIDQVLKQPDTTIYFKDVKIIDQNKVRLELSDKTQTTVSLDTLTPAE